MYECRVFVFLLIFQDYFSSLLTFNISVNMHVYVDLAGLGDNVPPLQSVAKTAEAFISSLYAIPSRAGTTADDVRYTHGQIINFM